VLIAAFFAEFKPVIVDGQFAGSRYGTDGFETAAAGDLAGIHEKRTGRLRAIAVSAAARLLINGLCRFFHLGSAAVSAKAGIVRKLRSAVHTKHDFFPSDFLLIPLVFVCEPEFLAVIVKLFHNQCFEPFSVRFRSA
jgi:hypothetical protein